MKQDQINRQQARPDVLPAGLPEGCVYLSDGMKPLSGRQIGLVPGAEAPLLAVTLPDRLRGFAREQVGFRHLRDALGQKALELRPFSGGGPKGVWTRALAADRKAAAHWRALAGAGGRAVLPDYLALPASAGLWVLAVEERGVMARLGPEDGFSALRAVALRQLQATLAAGVKPKAVLLLGEAPDITALFEAQTIPVVTEVGALAKLKIEPPKRFAHGELAADLRREPGAARDALACKVLPWRWPLIVGAIAAALWSGAQILAMDGVQAREKVFREDTLARVRASFVPNGPILDARVQVARALAEARAAADGAGDEGSPLDLFERAAEVIHGAGARTQSLNYTPQEGINAVVLVSDFAEAEGLAAALQEAGLGVQLIEARGEGEAGKVRAELRLTLDGESGG